MFKEIIIIEMKEVFKDFAGLFIHVDVKARIEED